MLFANTVVTQFIPLLLVLMVITCYLCTCKHPLWQKSIQVKLSIPILFTFSMICILCSIIYTYIEYAGPSENDHYIALSLNELYQQRRVYRQTLPSEDYSTFKGLINIGSVHSATSTMKKVICMLDDVICGIPSEFSYFNDRNEQIYFDIFTQDPTEELLYDSNLIELGNWSIIIDTILDVFTYENWLLNWDLDYLLRRTSIRRYIHKTNGNAVDFSKYMLYGKFTGHYMHPPTAIVFSHMAYHRQWKFFLQIREPISRLWSVQQHWHRYRGDPKQIREKAATNIWKSYERLDYLKTLVSVLKNMTISNDYIIGLYYRLYFNTLRELNDAIVKTDRRDVMNEYSFEVTTSLYCVHVMFWLKHFRKYFDENDIYSYFRIIQYEYITKDITQSKTLLYCWFKENVANIQGCSYNLPEIKAKLNFENKIREAKGHIWSVEMSWEDRKRFMNIYESCNQRLDMIVEKSHRHIVLGDWISYNKLYKDERQKNHRGDGVIDHPERNTKGGRHSGHHSNGEVDDRVRNKQRKFRQEKEVDRRQFRQEKEMRVGHVIERKFKRIHSNE